MMSFAELRMALPITCDCGHLFRINAIGLTVETDIVCPSCGVVERLDAATIAGFED